MATTLVIKLSPGQPIQSEVIGAQGNECLKLTQPLRAAGTVVADKAKPELHTQTVTTTIQINL